MLDRSVYKLDTEQGEVTDVAVSSDCTIAATAGADGSVCVWDLQSRTKRWRLVQHQGRALSVAFNPTGEELVSTSEFGVILRWDVESASVTQRLEEFGSPAVSAIFAGDRIVAAAETGILRSFRPDGSIDQEIELEAQVTQLAVAPGGTRVAAGLRDGRIAIYALELNEITDYLVGHNYEVTTLVFAPSGGLLVSGSADGTARTWSLPAHGRPELQSVYADLGRITSVDFTKRGQIVTGNAAGRVFLWEHCADGLPLRIQATSDIVTALTAGDDMLVLATGAGSLQILDLNDPGPSRTLTLNSHGVQDVAVTPSGSWVIAAWKGRYVSLVPTDSQLIQSIVEPSLYPDLVDIDSCGQRFLTGNSNGTIQLWRRLQDTPFAEFSVGERLMEAGFTQDGSSVIAVIADGRICVSDATDGKLVRSLRVAEVELTAARLTPSGALLADSSGRLTAWRIDGYPESSIVLEVGRNLSALASTADNSLILVGYREGTITCWEPLAKEIRWQIAAHESEVTDLKILGDGSRVVSCSTDGRVSIWDTLRGQHTYSFPKTEDPIWSLAASDDGRMLALGTWDRVSEIKKEDETVVVRGLHREESSRAAAPAGWSTTTRSQGALKLWVLDPLARGTLQPSRPRGLPANLQLAIDEFNALDFEASLSRLDDIRALPEPDLDPFTNVIARSFQALCFSNLGNQDKAEQVIRNIDLLIGTDLHHPAREYYRKAASVILGSEIEPELARLGQCAFRCGEHRAAAENYLAAANLIDSSPDRLGQRAKLIRAAIFNNIHSDDLNGALRNFALLADVVAGHDELSNELNWAFSPISIALHSHNNQVHREGLETCLIAARIAGVENLVDRIGAELARIGDVTQGD
jgi:WD40 repeat protein